MKYTNIKKIYEKNKILSIVGIIILISIIIILRFFVFHEKLDENLAIMFDENKFVAFSENDRYGYMNVSGEVIIQPEYKSASEFYGEYAVVELVSDKPRYKIIDKTGAEKMMIESDVAPKYYGDYGVWLIENKIYDVEMNAVFEGDYNINYLNYGYFEFMNNNLNESGIVDYKGKVIYKWDQDYISTSVSLNEYDPDGYYALINNYEEEEKIINLKNGKELFDLEDAKNTYIRAENDNIFRIIDRSDSFKTKTWIYCKDGKIVYKSDEEIYSLTLFTHDPSILEIDYGPNYKEMGLEKQYAYYNVETEKTLEDKPNNLDRKLMEIQYSYYITSDDNKKFGIYKRNKEILEKSYDEIKFLDQNVYDYVKFKNGENLILLKKDNFSYLYNMRKKKIIETFESNSITTSPVSTFLLVTTFEEDGYTKKGYLVYNMVTHKSKEFQIESEIKVGSNYISVKTGDKISYYNIRLESIR